MTMKPFEIQSPALSINGVLIDTSAQGKLVIPGVTRAGTSVAIEVEDTGDQSVGWQDVPVVIDGYTYELYITGNAPGIAGFTAATYVVEEIDDEGHIDNISVVSGGANYSGDAVTYSQIMYAAPNGTPINNSTNDGSTWVQIPFKVRCGAGEIESEFGNGGGNVDTGDFNFDGATMSVLPYAMYIAAGSTDVEFLGYIDNGLGGASGATLHVTSIVKGTITNGMTIYGDELPEEGWTLNFGGVIGDQGSGGVGNYYLPGANYLTEEITFTGEGSKDAQVWTFDGSGKLTLPNGGDIVDGSGNSVLGGGGGGSSTLSGLTDVSLDGPTDGQVLMWVNGQQRWENMDLPSGGVVNQLTNGSFAAVLESDGNLTIPGNINAVSSGFSFTANIASVTSEGTNVYVNLTDPVFEGPIGSEVTITGVVGTTQINGTWYYMATDPGQFMLFTDNTYSTPIDGSGWGEYESGGLAVDSAVQNDLAFNVGPKTWQLNQFGDLTLPSAGRIIAQVDNEGVYSVTTTPDGIDFVWSGQDIFSINKGPGGGSINAETGKSLWVTTNGGQRNWEFTTTGNIRFPDGSQQSTAYIKQNINLDGGGATVQYDADIAFVDGGFSSTRHGVVDPTFDGGNTLTESNQLNLDGGGA